MALTFTQALDGYYLHLRARRLSEHTLADYANTFRKFAEYMADDPALTAIDRGDVQSFLASFDPELISAKTLLNYHTGLSAFYTWAVAEGLAPVHIVRQVAPPDPEKKEIIPYTEADVKLMLASLERTKPYHRAGQIEPSDRALPNPLRNRAIILTLLDTGLRASELCSLRLANADLKNQRLTRILGKGNRERTVLLSAKTAKAIWRYLATRPEAKPKYALFPGDDDQPFQRQSLARLIKRIGDRAGVPHAHPHRFRHTFAINFLKNGGNIFVLQELLGHSSLEMVKHYLHLANLNTEEVHRHASPVANWNL